MKPSNFRSDIQGLRGICVLAVVLFHVNPTWLPGGFVGVDVFMVISGFLITRILLDPKQISRSLAESMLAFYVSRFLRIIPAYMVMVGIISIGALVFFLPSDFEIYQSSLLSATFFNSNSYFSSFSDYFAPASYEQPLLHTWSLAVEIKFYLVAPIIILLLPRSVLKWLFLLLIILATLYAEYGYRVLGLEQSNYYGLLARLPAFLSGGLAALTLPKSGSKDNSALWGSLGLTMIIFSMYFQPWLGPFPGFASLIPVVGAVMVLRSSNSMGLSRLLVTPGLILIGTLSYSIYLWHWPILSFIRYYTGSHFLSVSQLLLFTLLTVAASLFSYLCVEKNRESSVRRILMSLLPVFLLVGLAQAPSASVVNSRLGSPALSAQYLRYEDPSLICHNKILESCYRGDLLSDSEVLVLGDSHAAMLNHFFNVVGADNGFRAEIVSASICMTFASFDVQRIDSWARENCKRQIAHATGLMEGASNVVLAGSWNLHLERESFVQSVRQFLEDNSAKRILILGQEPLLMQDPIRIMRFRRLGFDVESEINDDYLRTNEILRSISEEYEHVLYLRLDDLPVFDQVPFYNQFPIYFDTHHLNEYGSIVYGRYASEYFSEVFD